MIKFNTDNFKIILKQFFIILFFTIEIVVLNPTTYGYYFLIFVSNLIFINILNKKFTENFISIYKFTAYIQVWSILSTNVLYKPFHNDYGYFSIPIYKFINPDLFSNDLQAISVFPHQSFYYIFSIILDSIFFEYIFYFLTIFQSVIFANIFLKLKIYSNLNFDSNIFYFLPLLLTPLSAGLYTFLPYFLPSVFGFGLSALVLINSLLLGRNTNLILYFSILIVHPFWGLITPLIIFFIHSLNKNINVIKFLKLLITLIIYQLIYFDSQLSIFEMYQLAKEGIFFLETTGKAHYYWFNAGNSIIGTLNGFIQVIPLLIAVYTFNPKINFKEVNIIFLNFIRFSALLLLIINFLPNTFLHNLMISTNFMRLGSYAWILLGIFIAESNSKEIQFNSFLLLVFSNYLVIRYFYDSFFIFILFLITIVSIFNYFKITKLKTYQIFGLIGLITVDYLLIPYNFFTEISIIFTIGLLINYVFKTINFLFNITQKNLIATLFLHFLFPLIFFLNVNFSLNIEQELTSESINKVKSISDSYSLFLIDPHDKYFRRDFQRSALFTYSHSPLDIESAKLYMNFYEYFKDFDYFDSKDFEYLIKSYKITHLYLDNQHQSIEILKEIYDYLEVENKIVFLIKSN